MGFLSKLGEFAKMGMDALVEEANKKQEYYETFYDKYSSYDVDRLKHEYEMIKRNVHGTDMKSMMRRKAFKDVCIEKGLIHE